MTLGQGFGFGKRRKSRCFRLFAPSFLFFLSPSPPKISISWALTQKRDRGTRNRLRIERPLKRSFSFIPVEALSRVRGRVAFTRLVVTRMTANGPQDNVHDTHLGL